MRVHYLQHSPDEGPGQIGTWAAENRHAVSGTQVYLGEAFPDPEEIDWLVIMGGAMNVYEYRNHPWLRPEKQFIEKVLAAGRTTIGVCLGAQLIADVSGAKVYQNREIELGWFPVRMLPAARANSLFREFPETLTPLHWHGDTFDLPRGAIRIAETDACPNQAFTLGDRIIGLQFHIEVAGSDVTAFLRGFEPPPPGPFIQNEAEIRAGAQNLAPVHAALHAMLNGLATHPPGPAR